MSKQIRGQVQGNEYTRYPTHADYLAREERRAQYERTKAHCPECGGDLFGDENQQECVECDWCEDGEKGAER